MARLNYKVKIFYKTKHKSKLRIELKRKKFNENYYKKFMQPLKLISKI